MTNVPGLGAKTARRLHDELGIATLAELKEAAEAGRLRGVKGMGQKAEENILASVGRLEDEGAGQRRLLSKVLPVAEDLARSLREVEGAKAVEVAGSARRWAETCKDIDLIATGDDPDALAKALAEHPLAAVSGSAGDAGARIVTHHGVKVDLRVSRPQAFGNLLQHFTGSAEHNVALRERALAKGLSISEHGIKNVETGKVTLCKTEEQVYRKVGLPYIEPELREGSGELAAAAKGELPELVSVGDIRGDLHCHTTLSDGRNSLEEMAQGARDRGYAYLAVTDHSASHGFGNHVTPKQLAASDRGGARARREAAALQAARRVGGQHRHRRLARLLRRAARRARLGDRQRPHPFRMGEREMTDRIVAAIENPLVDCIGHLTGRLHPAPPRLPGGRRARDRGGGRGGDDARDQREPQPPRPLGALRAARRRGRREDRRSTPTPTASTRWPTWPTASRPRAAPGSAPAQIANTRNWRDFKKLLKELGGLQRLSPAVRRRRGRRMAGGHAVAAQARRADEAHGLEDRRRLDVEAHAVAVLDAGDDRLAVSPLQRDEDRVAGSDHRDLGPDPGDRRGDERDQADRPQAAERDPSRALDGQGRLDAGAGERLRTPSAARPGVPR